jgi:hypothetical protein
MEEATETNYHDNEWSDEEWAEFQKRVFEMAPTEFFQTLSSSKWQPLQEEYYQSIDSHHQSATSKWIAGLITNLLMVTHSQCWLHCCTFLHQKDAQ